MKNKVCLVLEGGGYKGLFTAGILDVLMEKNINIDCIIGVSSGALYGLNYFSKQKGRTIRYMKKYCNDKRFISKKSYILTGNLVNKHFAYYKVPTKLDIFDNNTFLKNKKDFYAVVTNINTGKAEYFKIENPLKSVEVLRATSALPFVSKIIKLNNQYYLDGDIADSIPLLKAQELGFKKIILILVHPLNYIKSTLSIQMEKSIKTKFKKYPKLINLMLTKYQRYNEITKKINQEEQKGKIFVFRPSTKIAIETFEKNANKLQEVYDLGVKVGQENISKLLTFLK